MYVGTRSRQQRAWSRVAPFLVGATFVLILVALWEGYKAFGQRFDNRLPGLDWKLPVATDDLAMPHTTEIVGALFEPTRRGSDEVLLVSLLRSAASTMLTSAAGLLLAFVVGVTLAVLLAQIAALRRGLTPWIVASQTVPLVAIAPMVIIWGSKANLPAWASVATISAYLAFFPITVNTLRGLRSPETAQLELMRSYAASTASTMAFLRVPTALPLMFSGLRLAATAAVVGAIVGELSAGTVKGIGADLLTYSYFYSNGPEKLYAAVIIAALVGIVFVQIIAVLDRIVLRHRRPT